MDPVEVGGTLAGVCGVLTIGTFDVGIPKLDAYPGRPYVVTPPDPAGAVPGGMVGGGTGGYAGADASFTGGALATMAADSLLNPSVMAWTILSLPSRISPCRVLSPSLHAV